MKKSYVIIAFILVTAAGLYLYDKQKNKNNAIPALTESEKNDLFEKAMGYRGGANPPQEVMKKIMDDAAEAKLKIDSLGLQQEFEDYVNAQQLLPQRP